MKKLYFLLVGLEMSVSAFTADFEYYWEGNTLKYTVVSEAEKLVLRSLEKNMVLRGIMLAVLLRFRNIRSIWMRNIL